MTTAPNVVPFRPRPAEPAASASDTDLMARLLGLVGDFDAAGYRHVAALLLLAAYEMAEDGPPDDDGGECKTA